MQQAIDFLENLILGLFALIMGAIGTLETVLRRLMTESGIRDDLQRIVLVAAAVLLIVAALRLFGGIFGFLITLLLLLLVVHVLLPGLHIPAANHS